MGYSKNFWLICWAMFLFMTSFNLIIPDLNEWLRRLGGEDLKGMIFFLFTLSSALIRPFSGKLSDTIGRKPVMYIGIAVAIFAALLYPIFNTVLLFLTLRFFHGFCVGFFPTGSTALITDILPKDKRGIGMGIWGTFTSLGIGVGQGIGSLFSDHFGLDALFMFSSILSVFSLILVFYVKESLPAPVKFQVGLLNIPKADIIEKQVLPSAIVMFLSAMCSGIIFVVTPDMSAYMGLKNKGWFFLFYVVCTIFVRLFFGSLSDKIGRRKTLTIGILFLIASMLMIGYSTSAVSYTWASVIFGVATGITSPTLFAWTADLSSEDRRGIGAGTMFIALETGIMAGAFATMLTYKNNLESVPVTFWVGAISSALAVIYLIWHQVKYKK